MEEDKIIESGSTRQKKARLWDIQAEINEKIKPIRKLEEEAQKLLKELEDEKA